MTVFWVFLLYQNGAVIEAKQMKRNFVVQTIEGTMKGQAGDYLIIGVRGERYPCAKEIFEETYDEVKE